VASQPRNLRLATASWLAAKNLASQPTKPISHGCGNLKTFPVCVALLLLDILNQLHHALHYKNICLYLIVISKKGLMFEKL